MWRVVCVLTIFIITLARPAAAEWTTEKLRDARIDALATQEAEATAALQAAFTEYRSMLDDLLLEERLTDFDADHRSKATAWTTACNAQDWDACHALGDMLDAGRGTLRDRPLAQAIYWLGCHAKHGPSCASLFESSENDADAPFTGISPAKPYYTESCMHGDAQACRVLAVNYRRTSQTGYPGLYSRDPDLAEAMADLACQFDPSHTSCPGHAEAKPEPSDADELRAQLDAGCAAGSAAQCRELADLLGAKDKPDQAIEVQLKACDLGDSWSCYYAANNLLDGLTVAPDAERALKIMAQNCEDHALGCDFLIRAYLDRGAVDMARQLLHAGCHDQYSVSHEIAWACTQLIELGADILSPEIEAWVAPDLRDHVQQTRVGCHNGDASACRTLAITAQGYSDAPLFMHSYTALMQRACDLGHLGSCSEITRVVYEPNSAHPHDRACAAGFPEACTLALTQDRTLEPQVRMDGLQELCAAGNGTACRQRGLALERILDLLIAPQGTWGPRKDYDGALASYQAGCDLGDARSCMWLARLQDPDVLDRDAAHLKKTVQEARTLYLQACDLGSWWACASIAEREMYRTPVEDIDFDCTFAFALIGCRDGQDCRAFFQARLKREHALRVAEHGAVPAALMVPQDMVAPDWRGPLQRLSRSCARNITADCISLGELLDAVEQGENIKMRYLTEYPEISQVLYLHACNLGDGDGCAVLGDRLKYGWFQDPERALVHARRGCDLGSSRACFLAATFHEEYSEFPDPDLAYAYTRKACTGNASLQCQILHKPGDDERAAELDIRILGCVHGDAGNCSSLAKYDFERDPAMQRALHEIGCRLGGTRSCDALQRAR